jgi:hypothetical protein
MAFNSTEFKKRWGNGEYREALRMPLETPSKGRLKNMLFGNKVERSQSGAILTISTGDFLYDYIRIDPNVVKGIDFARADDLSSIASFSVFARGIDTSVNTGDIAQLQGYVAEKIVALELQARGHDVQFPETSNQEGWDILVDGMPFQVKNWATSQGVYEHFEKYPDIPVLVNEELASNFQYNPMVYPVDGISHAEIVDLTKTNLDLGADLHDFQIPMISLLVSTYFNGKLLIKKDINSLNAGINILTDTSSRVVGGTAGNFSGSALGGALFGPAGILVGGAIGAFFGIGQGGRIASFVKSSFYQNEKRNVRMYLAELLDKTAYAIDKKVSIRDDGFNTIELYLNQKTNNKKSIHALSEYYNDNREYLTGIKNRMLKLSNDLRNHIGDLDEQIVEAFKLIARSGVHPVMIQKELKNFQSALNELKNKIGKSEN